MRMQTRISAAILTAVLLGAGAVPAAAQFEKAEDAIKPKEVDYNDLLAFG